MRQSRFRPTFETRLPNIKTPTPTPTMTAPISIELANEIARTLEIKVQFIALEKEVGAVEGDTLSRFRNANEYYVQKNAMHVTVAYTKYHVGCNYIGGDKYVYVVDGAIVSFTDLNKNIGWCAATNAGHAGWCDNNHPSKVTFNVDNGIKIETIEVNGVATPYRYKVNNKHYTPAEWEKRSTPPIYVPLNQEFPADITLPDGRTVHCETVRHVPRVGIPIPWAYEHNLVPRATPWAKQKIEEYAKYLAELGSWHKAHDDLASGYWNTGFKKLRVSTAQRAVISELLYESKPEWHGYVNLECGDFQ